MPGMPGIQRVQLLQRIRLVVNRPARVQGELTIGIVGPHELVERIMLSPSSAAGKAGAGSAGLGPESGPPRRLVAAAYRDEQEAADQVVRLGASIDVCLFASRVPYEYARTAGVLTVPATFVPLGGSALYAALLKASGDSAGAGLDPAPSSIDVLSRADVEEAFAELGLPMAAVHVCEDSGSPAVVASFHERLWRRNETSVAFTCLQSVAARLSAAGIPAVTLRPTGRAIRRSRAQRTGRRHRGGHRHGPDHGGGRGTRPRLAGPRPGRQCAARVRLEPGGARAGSASAAARGRGPQIPEPGDLGPACREALGERRQPGRGRGNRRAAARRHPANGAAAAAHPGRGGPRLAAAAEPDTSARPAPPVLPARV